MAIQSSPSDSATIPANQKLAFDSAAFDLVTSGQCTVCHRHNLACACARSKPARIASPDAASAPSVPSQAVQAASAPSVPSQAVQAASAQPFQFGVKQFGKTKLSAAIKHNRRTIPGTYDPRRTHLNEIMAGPNSAGEVMPLAESLVKSAGDNPRKNATWCIELLFSLAPDHCLPEQAYFESCLEWVVERYGAENILTADIHRDEAAPHMHILVLPLRDGQLQGSAIVGGKAKLYAMRADFESKVRKPLVGD